MQHFNNQIPKIKNGNSIHPQTCIKRNNFRFRWTVRNRSLLLSHPTYGNKRVTNIYKIHLEVHFEYSRSPAKSEAWNSPKLHCCAVFPTWHISLRCTCKSNEPTVCHKLWSIWWQLVQVCLLTIECLAYQCVPNTGISEQFENIALTILQQIPILLLWIDGHQGMELLLCTVAGVFCSPARSIAPRISLHGLPYHRSMARCLRQVSLSKIVFLLLLQRSWIQTYFWNFPQYLCSFRILVECNPN